MGVVQNFLGLVWSLWLYTPECSGHQNVRYLWRPPHGQEGNGQGGKRWSDAKENDKGIERFRVREAWVVWA